MYILIVCAGGVSTSIMAEAVKQYADAEDTIKAITYGNLNKLVSSADIVMVAPQIIGLFDSVKSICDRNNTECRQLDMSTFGRMDGETVIALAREALQGKPLKGEKKMKKLKITLACAGGVSTSILCNRIVKECADRGFETECKAYGAGGLKAEQVEGSNVILIGPQVSYMEDDVVRRFPDIPVRLMSMMDYGTMNAKNIVNALFEEFNW